MKYAERIRTKIEKAFQPVEMELEDESARHHGHGGAHAEGETHFRLRVIAEVFRGVSRVERQRMVYALLADEMTERVHALSLSLKSPDEA
jgi:BolA protein